MKDQQTFQDELAHRQEVGRRLRITAHELGYRTTQALADWLGANRPQVTAWFNALAMPPVKYMAKLAVERGVTLDWIYRGDGSALPNAMYIRLVGAMEAGTPPPDVAPEPEPAPEPQSPAAVYPLRKAPDAPARLAKTKRASAA